MVQGVYDNQDVLALPLIPAPEGISVLIHPTDEVVPMASRSLSLAESFVESMEVRATRQRVDNKDGEGDKKSTSK